MKRFSMVSGVALLIFGLVIAIGYMRGNILGFQFWSWHQKLTIQVDTPKGTFIASSVAAANWDMPPRWFKIGDSGGWHGAGSLSGEAVALEIAPNRYLFVLLKGYSSDLAIQLFADPPLRSGHPDEYKRVLDQLTIRSGQSRELSAVHYPLLVTFGDIANPATVMRVDPSNLEAAFGPGFRLNSITMAITDEPVTTGRVEQLLGWWKSYADKKGRMAALRYPDSSPRGYDTLGPLDFWSPNNIPK